MTKRLYGGHSDVKKAYFAAGPTRIAKNKIRKMKKHLKRHPNDLQTANKTAP